VTHDSAITDEALMAALLQALAGDAAPEEGPEIDWVEVEIRSAPIASFGPTERDRAIFQDIYGRGLPFHYVSTWSGLSELSVRNIARQTMKRIAREQARWDRMSLLELVEESERLDELWQRAMEAWYASQATRYDWRTRESTRGGVTKRSTTITKTPQTGNTRFLEIARRIGPWLRVIGAQIEERAAEWAAPSVEPSGRRAHAPCTSGLRRDAQGSRTVPKRTRRRKRMGGSGLRLPRYVGTATRAAAWTVVRKSICIAQLLQKGMRHLGIPPPAT